MDKVKKIVKLYLYGICMGVFFQILTLIISFTAPRGIINDFFDNLLRNDRLLIIITFLILPVLFVLLGNIIKIKKDSKIYKISTYAIWLIALFIVFVFLFYIYVMLVGGPQ